MIKKINKPLQISFIGGGVNSSIGNMHFMSSQLDSNFIVKSGFFSRNKIKNIQSMKKYKIEKDRLYFNLDELIKNEKDIVDFFLILTPTPNHFKTLIKLIKANVNIIIEKPILSNLREIKIISRLLKNYKKKIYTIYNYTGYPAIREIKHIIYNNNFGKLLSLNIFMTQESFLRNQNKDQKIKIWRKVDKEIPNLFLDLGIHVYNLSNFLTNLKPLSVFSNVIEYKNIIADAKIFIKYNNETKGLFWISKASLGKRNNIDIELFFEKCSIKWSQENFENIIISHKNGTKKVIDRSVKSFEFHQSRYNRYRMGHPAGFIEAFANMYHDIALDFLGKKNEYIFDYKKANKDLKFLNFATLSYKKNKWIKINNL